MLEGGSSAVSSSHKIVTFRSPWQFLRLTLVLPGMAMRLSFNLALHQDLKPYIAKGIVSSAEADLRRTVFWAAFVVE